MVKYDKTLIKTSEPFICLILKKSSIIIIGLCSTAGDILWDITDLPHLVEDGA